MSENMRIRLPDNVLSALKKVAESHKQSLSDLFEDEIKRAVQGEMPVMHKEAVKATTLYIDGKCRDSFKQKAAEAGMPFDKAIKLLAEQILAKETTIH